MQYGENAKHRLFGQEHETDFYLEFRYLLLSGKDLQVGTALEMSWILIKVKLNFRLVSLQCNAHFL